MSKISVIIILVCAVLSACHHSHQNQAIIDHDCDFEDDSLQASHNDDYGIYYDDMIIWYPNNINKRREDSIVNIFQRHEVETYHFKMSPEEPDVCLGFYWYLYFYVQKRQRGVCDVTERSYIEDGFVNGIWIVKDSTGVASLIYYKYSCDTEFEC